MSDIDELNRAAIIAQLESDLERCSPEALQRISDIAARMFKGEPVKLSPDIPNPFHFREVAPGGHSLELSTGRVVTVGCLPSTPVQLAKAHYVGHRMIGRCQALPPPPLNLDNGANVKDRRMFLNDTFGDCVVASEARYKQVISVCTGQPEIEIPDDQIKKWYFAATGGRDSGLNIGEAMDRMGHIGLVDAAGKSHTIGVNCKGTIDFTNRLEVMLAIQEFKSIKVGLDASPLQRAVQNKDGWFIIAGGKATNINHCTEWSGYGTADFFAQSYNCSVPNGVDKATWGLIGDTWHTVGFADFQSFVGMAGEVWIRKTDPDRGDAATWNAESDGAYTDTIDTNLSPTPIPKPTPVPPAPAGISGQLMALCAKAPNEFKSALQSLRSLVEV